MSVCLQPVQKSQQPADIASNTPLSASAANTAPLGSDILLHICCAPCATYPILSLRRAGFMISGYWYNPNVHPWSEHERRRESLISYAAQVSLPVAWEPGYDIVSFMRLLAGHEAQGDRCALCYRVRLGRTAACASRLGISRFTTTLLISPYQNQELIKAAGEAAAREHGVEFHFEDWRTGWSERGRLARQHGLYRQQYCGCLYSEFERYTSKPILAAAQASDENR